MENKKRRAPKKPSDEVAMGVDEVSVVESKQEVAVVPHKEVEIVPSKSPADLIAMAIEKGTNVDALEKLMGLQERWEAREAKKAFDRSMAAFQAECPTIQKTKEVKTKEGKSAYKYAPIESIVNQVKTILEKHGFSYSTSMELKEKGVKVAVKVVHTQGHSEISEMEVPFGTQTAIMSNSQQAAAAQTFAKRYAFCNAFGILTGDQDNDGATIETNQPGQVSRPAPARPTVNRPAAPAKQAEQTTVDTSDSQDVADGNRCQECTNQITQQEAVYSVRMYGKPLCRPHQADYKAGKLR